MPRSNRTKPFELELDITDLTHDGRGVARVENKAVFVSGALPGERVRAKITQKHRQYDEGETVEVLTRSPHRVDAKCGHFGVCGGCALQHLDPAEQILSKQRTLLENLERIGHVAPEAVLPPLVGEPWGYRRRGRLSVKHVHKKERTLVGFRESNGRYVADLQQCHVLNPAVGSRLPELSALVQSMDAREDIPQIEIAAGDAMTALVFRHMKPLSEGDRAKLVAFAQQTGLAVMLQPGGNDSVVPLWPDLVPLSFGLPDYQLDIAFEPLDFVQVNAAMNARMIDHALGLLDAQPDDHVLDLFCGLGNFTLPIARRAGHVVGVEGDSGLIARARANAERNGLGDKVEYFAANLFEDCRDTTWAKRDYQRVLLDPPRAGAQEILAYLPGKATHRVVYVSCHPASLARDAGILVNQHGFKLKSAGVMDMFPHTAHVESIALFERAKRG